MKLKLILAMIFAVNTAFAGKIIQNIEWNQIVPNETGQAVAQSERNLVSLGFSKSEDEVDGGDDLTYTTTNALFSMSNDIINIEGMGFLSKVEEEGQDDDKFKALIINAGKKFGNLSIGLNGTHFNADTGNVYTLGTGATYRLNDLISLGGGLNRTYENGNDFSYMEYYTGVGFTKKDFFAFEANYLYQPGEEKNLSPTATISVPKEHTLEAQGSINLGRFQLSPRLSSSFAEDDNKDKTTSTEFSMRAEYMINKMFYVGGLLSSEVDKFEDDADSTNDDTTTTSEVGITGRFKMDQFQVYLLVSSGTEETEYEDGSEDQKEDSTSMSLYGSYFF